MTCWNGKEIISTTFPTLGFTRSCYFDISLSMYVRRISMRLRCCWPCLLSTNVILEAVAMKAIPLKRIWTRWRRDKMAAILHTTFSIPFSWMRIRTFQLNCQWILFLSVQLTLFNHWFRYWLDASNYRKQWCNVLLTHICVTRLQWVSNSNLTKSHSLITSVSVPTEHACAFCIANIRSSVRFHSRSQHVWWCNLAAKGATASL